MSQALEHIRAAVSRTETAAASALELIKGLSAQIRESKDDPKALEELANDLDTVQADLASAVAANTAAANEPDANNPGSAGVEQDAALKANDTTSGGEGSDTTGAGDGKDTINAGGSESGRVGS